MTMQTMPRRQLAPIAPPPPAPFKPREHRSLFCFGDCQEYGEFHLNDEATLYECTECGWGMEYIINNDPHLYAIRFYGW